MDNVSVKPVTKSPWVVAFGNPLLDICVKTPENVDICNEIGVDLDGEVEVSSTVAQQLQQKISSFPKIERCGGSVLNTARILQWLIGCSNRVVFSGSIGKDCAGKRVREMAIADKVMVKLPEHSDLPTGVVTVLVHGAHRSLVACIGAAQFYSEEYLSDDLLNDIKVSKIVILEAYFALHNEKVCWKIVNECFKCGTSFMFLLGSVYVYENPSTELLNLVQCADIVIGNEREYRSLGKAIGIENPSIEALLHLILDWKICHKHTRSLKLKQLETKGKVLICTRSHKATICCEQASGAVSKVPVPHVDHVVDATGAGDAFAAGAVLGILLQKDFITSIQVGSYAASEIIKQVGCVVPDHPPLTRDPKNRIGAMVS